MSLNRNCELHERKPGEWYYVLENPTALDESFDWRMHATAYGSFPSEQVALDQLHTQHGNPGGHTTVPYSEDRSEDEILKHLLDNAIR